MPTHEMKVLGETHEFSTTRGTLLDVMLILFKVLAYIKARAYLNDSDKGLVMLSGRVKQILIVRKSVV